MSEGCTFTAMVERAEIAHEQSHQAGTTFGAVKAFDGMGQDVSFHIHKSLLAHYVPGTLVRVTVEVDGG